MQRPREPAFAAAPRHADTAQAGELLDHLAGPVRSIGRRDLIPFTLELWGTRCKYELQLRDEQTLNFGQCIWWDCLAEARSQFSQPATPTLKKRIIVVDAKRRQNSADSVREAIRSRAARSVFADDRRASSSASSGLLTYHAPAAEPCAVRRRSNRRSDFAGGSAIHRMPEHGPRRLAP